MDEVIQASKLAFQSPDYAKLWTLLEARLRLFETGRKIEKVSDNGSTTGVIAPILAPTSATRAGAPSHETAYSDVRPLRSQGMAGGPDFLAPWPRPASFLRAGELMVTPLGVITPPL